MHSLSQIDRKHIRDYEAEVDQVVLGIRDLELQQEFGEFFIDRFENIGEVVGLSSRNRFHLLTQDHFCFVSFPALESETDH